MQHFSQGPVYQAKSPRLRDQLLVPAALGAYQVPCSEERPCPGHPEEAKQAWHWDSRQSSSQQHPCPCWEPGANMGPVAAADNPEEAAVADNQTAEADGTQKRTEQPLETETVVATESVAIELPTVAVVQP